MGITKRPLCYFATEGTVVADKIRVILNSHGGRLDNHAKLSLVERGMKAVGLDYCLEQTEYPGHGLELAHQAALDGCSIVVAAGGDGTINEVVNGLLLAGR